MQPLQWQIERSAGVLARGMALHASVVACLVCVLSGSVAVQACTRQHGLTVKTWVDGGGGDGG